jgi:hypothetical protein
MKAAQNIVDTNPETVGFLVFFFLVALGSGLIAAVAVAHALAGNFAAAAPGAAWIAFVAFAHWKANREGHYSVIAVLILAGVAVGAVGGAIGHLVR